MCLSTRPTVRDADTLFEQQRVAWSALQCHALEGNSKSIVKMKDNYINTYLSFTPWFSDHYHKPKCGSHYTSSRNFGLTESVLLLWKAGILFCFCHWQIGSTCASSSSRKHYTPHWKNSAGARLPSVEIQSLPASWKDKACTRRLSYVCLGGVGPESTVNQEELL